MRGSLKLFSWFGIPVHLHWTFGLIFLYAFYIGNAQGAGLIGIVWIVGLFIALFGCVLLHEFGHSLTARRYGIETRDIILTPIGGIARLERMPEKPGQEFLVAIMGPMVNVVIAILLFLLGKVLFSGAEWAFFEATIADYFTPVLNFFIKMGAWLSGSLSWEEFLNIFKSHNDAAQVSDVLEETGLEVGGLLMVLPVLLSVNLWLVLFNMIPAFPMDGGRVFRSLLAMRIGRVRATRTASLVGQLIAVLFIGLGFLIPQFTLALIGFFVFTTARTENAMVQLDEVLRRYKASDLLRQQFTRLSANDWMQTPINMLRHGLERNFLVFDLNDQLVGALEEEDIAIAMKKRDFATEISRFMHPVETLSPDESLQTVYQLLRQQGHSILAVAGEEDLMGVIDEDGLRNFMRLQGMG